MIPEAVYVNGVWQVVPVYEVILEGEDFPVYRPAPEDEADHYALFREDVCVAVFHWDWLGAAKIAADGCALRERGSK